MTAHDVHLNAEVEAALAARAICRSANPHSVSTIRQACAVLQRYGDGTDYLLARDMLAALALKYPAPKPHPTPVPYSPQVIRIRDVLAGALLALSVAYVALIVMLGMPG
jgi:hypothetical protein